MKKDPIIKLPSYNPPGIIYGFVTKNLQGSSFSYDPHRKGSASNFENNRALVLNALGLPEHRLSILNQVHGNEAINIQEVRIIGDEIAADGQVTTNKNVILAIKTADCVPVLFHDVKSGVIGACHAGWKGAFSGIIESTINKMLSSGAKLDQIESIIGPCIQQDSYEVDNIFYQKFLDQDGTNNYFFKPAKRADHYMFDLPAYVAKRLLKSGINVIYNSNLDTLSDEERFFSYRLSTLRGEPLGGSILSVIGLE